MEISWLKTFVDAAETLNFRKTSERLLMSQPNVTVHIRLLEDSLGVLLFKRDKNRVTLTEEGQHFRRDAEKILNHLNESIEDLQAFAQGYRKKWTLAISPLMAETILPYILKSFTREHPDVELVIRIEESERIEELVEEGEVSAGLSALPPIRRNTFYETVYDDPILFILPRDAYDDETGPAVSAETALRNSYLFTHHHPLFWEELLVKLRTRVPGIRTMKVTQAYIAKRFIQEGLGVSFLPKSMVRRELIEGRLMDIHFDLFPLPVVSTYLLAKEMGELEQEFLKRIQSVYFS
ncbi:LysR family transcriptional regulator [Planococcus sp. N028]|uniref:LysR family transcriptional regulator n=1 Tax=Planococcus shixiaomingii TaxID=3058393 RepID=A0ABT8N572_9BACL|nr:MULTISPECIES: LysR family transcriptional regulator [unclassified Planococcus (in: firmicutes)]MDN7243029.1 LysR family transcriptional regulator [Planococcus sp. N028]WKA54971.1 LysR family transcriptional regulator [Planococcus sp. N022]